MIDENILKKVTNYLIDKKLKIAIAESCSGGLIAHTLTNISGSSVYFDRGLVSYSNIAKNELLNISKKLLGEYGAVSEPIAKEMAENIRRISKVDIGISTTGIAGPTGGTKDKPIGLVYIGLSTKKNTIVNKYLFKGNRIDNKISTCNAALKMIYEYLKTI